MLRLASFSVAVLAACPVIAQIPVPVAPPTEAPAIDTLPAVTGRGDAISNEEFNHRIRLGRLTRELEVLKAEAAIAEENARKAKAERATAGESETLNVPLPTIGGRSQVTFPLNAPIPSPRSNAEPPSIDPDVAKAPSVPSPPAPRPDVIGVIGSQALFKVADASVVAGPGDEVGDYRIDSIVGRQVTLSAKNHPSNKVSLMAP